MDLYDKAQNGPESVGLLFRVFINITRSNKMHIWYISCLELLFGISFYLSYFAVAEIYKDTESPFQGYEWKQVWLPDEHSRYVEK